MGDNGTADTLASASKAFSPANRRRLSAPGLRTFLAIADLWGLTEPQRRLALGNPSIPIYRRWVRTARMHGVLTLTVDVLARISAVLGIHQALGILFKTEAEGIEWLRGPHKATVFGGQPPLSLIANGDKDSLLTVRRFLEAAQGGLYMAPNEIDADFQPYTDGQIVDVSAPLSTSPDQAPVADRPGFGEGEHHE
jgi:Protein of unknown function (DUF2384)